MLPIIFTANPWELYHISFRLAILKMMFLFLKDDMILMIPRSQQGNIPFLGWGGGGLKIGWISRQ